MASASSQITTLPITIPPAADIHAAPDIITAPLATNGQRTCCPPLHCCPQAVPTCCDLVYVATQCCNILTTPCISGVNTSGNGIAIQQQTLCCPGFGNQTTALTSQGVSQNGSTCFGLCSSSSNSSWNPCGSSSSESENCCFGMKSSCDWSKCSGCSCFSCSCDCKSPGETVGDVGNAAGNFGDCLSTVFCAPCHLLQGVDCSWASGAGSAIWGCLGDTGDCLLGVLRIFDC